MKKINPKALLPFFLKHKPKQKNPGSAPGTLKFTGQRLVDDIQISLYDFDKDQFSEQQISDISDSTPFLESPSKTWINVKGLHDVDKLKNIWNYFSLHPLIQEDIIHTQQRAKIEQYPNHMFFVLKIIYYNEKAEELHVEQLSIVLGDNWVLSFQESDLPIFEPIIHRLRNQAPRLRNSGADYLSYALIDTIVDHYFNVLGSFGNEIEVLEDNIIKSFDDFVPEQIHALRRKINFVRKSVWPFRDSLNGLIRDESDFINEDHKVYFRDVHDHLFQIIEGLDNYREMVMGMLDLYMSQVSNKMNEVMKVLTIIATIFIPLTFIAGIYGMNFEYMPELGWKWAYPTVWVLMIASTLGMVYYFRKKKWL